MVARPFSHDPSATAAFAALRESQPVVARDERLRVVVIGGGTGAPVSIRTLLSMGLDTSAVVAMADDGGSTGILREEADVTPPGDVRKCIAAMAADPNDPLTKAFKYRFSFARNHTLGNLMLSALEDAAGSFPEAISICERLLDARGHVYPSTLDRVTLTARTRDGRSLEGQAVACHSRTALERVGLRAAHEVVPYQPALEAIREADLIVLGPGSLFTSIIPNLLVPGVVDAIRASKGSTLFVCSLADMQGETWGLTAREHVEALMDHGTRGAYPGLAAPRQPGHGRVHRCDGCRLGARLHCRPRRSRAVRTHPPRARMLPGRAGHPGAGAGGHCAQPRRSHSSNLARSCCLARCVCGGVEAMSFTAEVKDELARVPPTCSHCEKATLAALVRIEGTLFFSGQGKYRIEIATDVPSVARLIIKLLHELYHLETNLTVRRSVLHKTPNYLIEAPSQPRLAPALVDMGVLSPDGGLELGLKPDLVEKQCCTAAYLRGAFLGSGFVSDPRGDFHFEITVESEDLAGGLVDLLDRKGIRARVMQRRSSYMVYLKSGSAILEFLAFAGAHQSALAMENARVIKSVRNDVNRMTNAEIANQAKAANASVDQLYAIRVVLEAHGMENLPPALQDFIKLRVTYPDATLKELGERANPPLSKSAVYHRVRRIEQMAKEAQG